MSAERFCQVCRHPVPGHEAGCPVETGQPVQAYAMPCPYCGGHGGQHFWAGGGACPGVLSDRLDGEIADLKTQIAGFLQEIRLLRSELEVYKAMR